MTQKTYTLITGASSGIGLELAKVAARKRQNLILVSRSKDKLSKIAKNIHELEKVSVVVIPLDLAKSDSAKKLYDEINKKKLSVDILINNAGFGSYGEFGKLDLQRELEMIQLNITTLTQLTHLFLPSMKKFKGKILNVASTAAFQSIPYMATYAASKAYVLSFSESLNSELSSYKVSVTALCPGPTKTNFDKEANMEGKSFFSGNLMDVREVAEIGFSAMMKGKSRVITGFSNKAGAFATRILPSKTSTFIAKQITKEK